MYKTYDQIVSEIQADMVASGSQATDFSDGSQIQTAIQVTARALYSQWYMLELLVELFFVSSCEGPLLDLRVGERGIIRKAGTAATGNITFTRTTASPISTDIPAGTTYSTLDGAVEITTNVDLPLAAQWTTGQVAVTCSSVGAIGNLAAGTQLQPIGPSVAGIQTITVGPGALSGGVDAESDDALRARYLFTIQNPVDGGTPADYQVWAEEVNGITNVSVFPLARGNGTVDVVVSANGVPTAAEVTNVQTVFNANRPIGADAQAKGATAHNIDVTMTVTVKPGYSFDDLVGTDGTVTPGVKTMVTKSITAYLSSVKIGDVVRVSAINDAAYQTAGVLDFSTTAPAANIQLGQEELAAPGNINITQGS